MNGCISDGPTNRQTEGRTDPLIEMPRRIKKAYEHVLRQIMTSHDAGFLMDRKILTSL